MPSYTDEHGNKHKLSKDDVQLGITLKLELQKANGRCAWNKWRLEMIKNGVDKDSLVVGEGLRGLIKSQQRKQKVDYSSDFPNTTKEAIGLLNYNKREEQNLVREYNKLKREVTDKQILRDYVIDALDHADFDFDKVKKSKRTKVVYDNPTAVVASFADLHVGASVDLPSNKYNEVVARERVMEYAEKLIDLVVELAANELYIANIGDMVEHVYMRFSQGFDTELTFSEQIQSAINIVGAFISELYDRLAPFGVDIYYTGIGGNHDRISGNKKDNVYHDSVAEVINGFVSFLADNVYHNKGFKFIEPDNIYRTHLSINGVNIKIVHGDLDKITQPNALGKISVYDNKTYKAVLGGHLHRYSVMEAGVNQYLVTSGSFKGMDNYSDQLSVGSSLSQAVLVVGNDGSIQTLNIELH